MIELIPARVGQSRGMALNNRHSQFDSPIAIPAHDPDAGAKGVADEHMRP